MPQNRDFAWLRSTLCDEIEAVRNGTADHTRAKSVAALAAAALKSVEVEAMVRLQHAELDGAQIPELGSVLLCGPTNDADAGDAAETVAPPRPRISNPVVPPGAARFVPGRAGSGSN